MTGLLAFIRDAEPEDAEELTALAFRSKAFWGYSDDFLEQCRDELTVTPEFIRRNHVFVLVQVQQIIGFYGLKPHHLIGLKKIVDMEYLFLDPDFIAIGGGTRLWRHAVDMAKHYGYSMMRIESDPNAQKFYERCGAELVGEVSSASIEGRKLPLLYYRLDL